MNACIEVALVVRNEERRARRAIDALLAQRGIELRLCVHDNASTDATPDRAREAAQLDPRVVHVRHETDLGALRNFARAARYASAPYFAWAAADDARTADHLRTLARQLGAHPRAALAATAARSMTVDGQPGPILRETAGLELLPRASAAARLAAWMRRAPCVPIYGLWRTASLRPLLPVLEDLADGPLLRADAVFLALVVAHHEVLIDPRPRFIYHLGGGSGALERFDTPRDVMATMRHIGAGFRAAARQATGRPWARAWLALAWRAHLLRLALGRNGRRQWMHALCAARPRVARVVARIAARTDPALRALARRARGLPDGSTVMLAGAGRHTHRRFEAIRTALGAGAHIAAIADDARSGSIRGVPIVPFAALADADVVVVSSDACEAVLDARARSVTRAPVWRLYARMPIAPDDRAAWRPVARA